jgi:predicted dehydrogenase
MKLAIIGCGAVFDQFQLPALKNIKKIPSVFIDINRELAVSYAKKYKGSSTTNYIDLIDEFDTAIVSVPHFLHAPICRDLLNNKKHVFIEKPFAPYLEEAVELIALAKKVNKTICVGNFRRYKKGTLWAKQLIASGVLGEIQEFHFREGGIYSWPATTNSFWEKEKACGGVLIDTGAHTIDQLCFLLGAADVIEYKDDAQGGVEANCFIELELENGTRGTVELSRTRNLGSSAYIKGSRGSLITDLVGGEIQTNPKDLVLNKYNNIIGNKVKAEPYVDLFAQQFLSWFKAIETSSNDYVKESDVLPSIKIIDNCYANKKEMNYNWI